MTHKPAAGRGARGKGGALLYMLGGGSL